MNQKEGRYMKVFRDITTAIIIGIIGGFLVSTIGYYQKHKEGGVKQTALAVLNSFDTVAGAYTDGEENRLLDSGTYTWSDQVEEAFRRIEDGEEWYAEDDKLLGIISGDASYSNLIKGEGDVIAMDERAMNLEANTEESRRGKKASDDGTSFKNPYSGIIRFHIRANSDAFDDQELKMAVKEDVIAMLRPLLSDCDSVEDSRKVMVENLKNIYTTAMNTIVEQGYDYPVKVYLTDEEFPAKTYGDLTFPAGQYKALRIDIGEAKGQNWWCVMYPPLCFMDGTTAVVTREGKEQLEEALTPEEFAALFADGTDRENVTIKTESKIYNRIKELMNRK